MEENGETQLENSEHKSIRKSVLDHFTNISSEKEATRLKFGITLLKHICTNEDPATENTELKYAVIRLVRGLGASKISSKVGYYSTLVALLQSCPLITVDDILQCVKKQLQTGDCKSENGDVYTGQILACGALLHSDLFLKATPEQQSSILQQIFMAGKKRSYLTLASSTFIADLLCKIDETQFRNILWPVLRLEVFKFWADQTIDSLYLLTLVLNRYPHVLKDASLKKHFGAGGLYSEENVKPICDILMNISTITSLKHPGYTIITQELSKSTALLVFMNHLDGQLVKPNRNRILATALIINTVIKTVDTSAQLPDLLLNNFIKQVLTYYHMQTSNYDKEFHDAMTTFYNSLYEYCKQDISYKIKVAVIRKFLFHPGMLMFEKITKTKIIQQFVSTLDEQGVKKLSKLYRGVISTEREKVIDGTSRPWLNSERTFAAQLLVKLLNLPCVQNNVDWKKKQLTFLIDVSIIKHPKYPNVGGELSGTLSEIFYRALDLKLTKLEDMRILLSDLVNHIATHVTHANYTEVVRISLTPDEFEIWQNTLTIINKLASKSKKQMVVFHVLFLHMGIQLFKEKELAISSLKELFLCYGRVRKDKKNQSQETSTNEPEWIEVVIDLFLNLLSHNSHLLRNVITSVFPHLCKYMTGSSLHQILSVLDPKYEPNPLSKDESEEDESENEESAESEESGYDDDDDEKETINDKLRMAVSNALGNDGYKTDEESIDLDKMSDTEGEKLDVALSEAFKQFKPNRGRNKKQTKDEETLTHFRVRVLDLLESYVNSEPTMLSCFEIMLPILQTLEFTIKDPHQSPLQARLKNCLKKLTAIKKFSSTDEVTTEILCDLLSSLLSKGTKSALIVQDMSNEISQCCIFVIKCVQIISVSETTPKKTKKRLKSSLLKILSDALEMYFNNRDCLIPYGLFKMIFRLNWEGNFALIPAVFNYARDDTMRPFRRNQALELLKIFYSNNRMHSNPEIFKEHVQQPEIQLCQKIVQLLDDFCANPNTNIKERFIYHIFNLLKVMLAKDIKNEEIDWRSIGEKIREYRSHVTLSKDAKKAYNQLCVKLGISNIVKMKNQVVKLVVEEDETVNDIVKDKIPKRKGATIESKKLKKQARELRIQSLSEGLSDSVSFSSSSLLNFKDNAKTNLPLSNGETSYIDKKPLVNGTSEKVVVKKRLNSESGEESKKRKHN